MDALTALLLVASAVFLVKTAREQAVASSGARLLTGAQCLVQPAFYSLTADVHPEGAEVGVALALGAGLGVAALRLSPPAPAVWRVGVVAFWAAAYVAVQAWALTDSELWTSWALLGMYGSGAAALTYAVMGRAAGGVPAAVLAAARLTT